MANPNSPQRVKEREEVEKLRGWIEVSQNHMKQKVHRRWRRILDQYRGKYVDFMGNEPTVPVNIVAGLVDLVLPTVYFQDPRLNLSPTRPGKERITKITETVLNHTHREIQTKRQIRQATIDTLLYGVGYVKKGWHVDIKTNLFPIIDETNGQALETGRQEPVLQDRHGNVFIERNGRPIHVLDEKGNAVPPGRARPTMHEYVRKQQPYARRWSPWDFAKDPEATDVRLSDAKWIAFRSIQPLDEVKGNDLFKNTKDLKATDILDPEMLKIGERDVTVINKDIDRVELWEVWVWEWDNHLREYVLWNKVIATNYDRFLLNRPSPFLAEGFPVSVLAFTEDPESANPLSLFDMIQPQIQTIIDSRSKLAQHRTRLDRRYLYNPNVIEEEEAEKVAQSGEAAIIPVDVDPEYDLKRAFVPIEHAAIAPEVYRDYELAWQEIQRILGMSDYQLAGQGPVRQATEANFIQGNFTVRIRDKQQAMADFFANISKFILQLYKQFGEFEQFVKITNDIGVEEWVEITLADLVDDDLDWDVDVFASNFQSKESERADSQNLYNLLRNDELVNPTFLIEKIGRSYGERGPHRILMQQPAQPPGTPPEEGVASAQASGQTVDINALRRDAPRDPGALGRAASGEPT